MSTLSALVAQDLFMTYGDRVVLDGVDLVASPGCPVGVVGENGAGKSTLLRLLAGVETPDAGTVARPADLGYLSQDPMLHGPATVRQTLTEALAPLHDAVRRLEHLAARLDDGPEGTPLEPPDSPGSPAPDVADSYAATLAWAEHHGAWDAARRAEVASARLGLTGIDPDRRISSLSGGERTRLALAALITRQPECVVLDEPTNHLDDSAMEFLEQFLAQLPGVVVLASHDRVLLDRVCTVIVDLDPAHIGADGTGGNRYSGDFTAYLEHKRSARRRWEQAFLDQQEELTGLRRAASTTARRVAHNRPPRDGDKLLYNFKAGKVQSTISRRVHDVTHRIEVIERDEIPKPPRELRFDSGALETNRRPATAALRDVVVWGRLRLARADIAAGEHLLVTGGNGTGKSTLLGVLAGRVDVDEGTVRVGSASVGLLPQDVRFSRPGRSASDLYADLTGSRDSDAVPALGTLGLLHPRDLSRPVGVLSVGQQRRLALAVLIAQRRDLLLLDEPTNHISLTLASELEEALDRAPGTIVIATHDRWLRARWSGASLSLAPPTR